MAKPMHKKQKLDHLVTEFSGLKRSVAKLLNDTRKNRGRQLQVQGEVVCDKSHSARCGEEGEGLKRPVLVKPERNVPDAPKPRNKTALQKWTWK